MITLHPSARRTRNGQWLPVVLIRDRNGRMVGSKTAPRAFTYAQGSARDYALWVALRVAAQHGNAITVA